MTNFHRNHPSNLNPLIYLLGRPFALPCKLPYLLTKYFRSTHFLQDIVPTAVGN